MEQIAERFLAAVRPTRRTERVTEDLDYVAMLWRMVRALEVRATSNPELITQVIALAQRFSEITNVVIAVNAERYSVDPHSGASMGECARLLGISKQSASERRARGAAIMGERIDAAGAARFAEARRERAAIDQAADHAVVSLADWRARKAVAA